MEEAFWIGIWVGAGFSIAICIILSLIHT